MEILDTVSFTNSKSFISGTVGGCAGVIISHPFDTIKVRLQSNMGNDIYYRNTLDCITKIAKKEGLRAFFKGISSPIAGVSIINSLAFGVYDNVLKLLNPSNYTVPKLSNIFFAGCVSGLANSFVSSPIELIKIQLQNNIKLQSFKGPLNLVKEIYLSNGIKGLYKGLKPTFIRELSYGPYFFTYELSCKYLAKLEHEDYFELMEIKQTTLASHHLGFSQLIIAGGLAGIGGWICIYPIDVIKTRIQSQSIYKPDYYSGIIDCISKLYKEGGIKIFFRGLNATLLRSVPSNAAILYFYTISMKLIESLI